MAECANLSKCAFFKTYENDENKQLALKGFINRYCKGDKQDKCIRMKVSQPLGGPEKVPTNMMPNGYFLPGTDVSNWIEKVQRIRKG